MLKKFMFKLARKRRQKHGTFHNPIEPTAAGAKVEENPRATPKDADGRPRLSSYASTGDEKSTDGSVRSSSSAKSESKKNPKKLIHSTSAIGLDEMIETRRENGDLGQNVVHIEVPFGKPIEEVYDGVHSGPVLGSGISGLVRCVTHKATGVQYAVKCLDLGLVDTAEGLRQLREEIFIMCQLDHPNIGKENCHLTTSTSQMDKISSLSPALSSAFGGSVRKSL